MNDNQVYNVIVLTEKEEMGELFVIAQDDNDCLNTITKLNSKYKVVSFNSLETFKEKVAELEKAKEGLVYSLRSQKMPN